MLLSFNARFLVLGRFRRWNQRHLACPSHFWTLARRTSHDLILPSATFPVHIRRRCLQRNAGGQDCIKHSSPPRPISLRCKVAPPSRHAHSASPSENTPST